jgi:hypothetical protein
MSKLCKSTSWLMLLLVGSIIGCAATPPPVAPGTVAAPMTLPRFLGLDAFAGGCHRVVYHSRLRIAKVVPMLEPHPMAAGPVAIGDPANLQSPAPSVAAAASIQKAHADAPAKASALAFLASYSCSQHPEVEEAFLSGMDDISEDVRIAAVQAIIDGQSSCSTNCNVASNSSSSCAGCCTPLIHDKLMQLAYAKNDQGCYCESSSRVRRLARLALKDCCAPPVQQIAIPEELPSPQTMQLIQPH